MHVGSHSCRVLRSVVAQGISMTVAPWNGESGWMHIWVPKYLSGPKLSARAGDGMARLMLATVASASDRASSRGRFTGFLPWWPAERPRSAGCASDVDGAQCTEWRQARERARSASTRREDFDGKPRV